MLLGVYDVGNGIIASQKTIRASQVTADLVARYAEVDTAMINDAIQGGSQALVPLDTSTFGVDVVSVRFDSDANASIEWRETQNMVPMNDVLARVSSLLRRMKVCWLLLLNICTSRCLPVLSLMIYRCVKSHLRVAVKCGDRKRINKKPWWGEKL